MTHSQDYIDGFAHGRDVGLATAHIRAQPRIDALVAALREAEAIAALAEYPSAELLAAGDRIASLGSRLRAALKLAGEE